MEQFPNKNQEQEPENTEYHGERTPAGQLLHDTEELYKIIAKLTRESHEADPLPIEDLVRLKTLLHECNIDLDKYMKKHYPDQSHN